MLATLLPTDALPSPNVIWQISSVVCTYIHKDEHLRLYLAHT